MKVKELIKLLLKCNPEKIVRFDCYSVCDVLDIDGVNPNYIDFDETIVVIEEN